MGREGQFSRLLKTLFLQIGIKNTDKTYKQQIKLNMYKKGQYYSMPSLCDETIGCSSEIV